MTLDNLLSGFLGAGLLASWQWLVKWLTGPKLTISFLESLPGYKVFTTETRRHPDAGSNGVSKRATQDYKAMYASICVRNDGRQNAKACRGFLVGVDVRGTNRQWEPTDYCDSIPLAWSYRPDDDARHGIDIPPGVNQFLNIFSVRQPPVDKGFRPATIPPTLRFAARFRFKEPGEFRFRIQVAADGIPAQLFGIYLRWDGTWDDELWRNARDRIQICECTDLY